MALHHSLSFPVFGNQCPPVADIFIDYSKKVVELNSKAEMGLKEVLFPQHDKNVPYEQE